MAKKKKETVESLKAGAYDIVCAIEQRQVEIKQLVKQRSDLHNAINELLKKK
jgi:hypothetical protein